MAFVSFFFGERGWGRHDEVGEYYVVLRSKGLCFHLSPRVIERTLAFLASSKVTALACLLQSTHLLACLFASRQMYI